MKFMSLIKLQSNFLFNWPLSEKVTNDLINHDEYLWPHKIIDFSLFKHPSTKIIPLMGSPDELNKPGELEIRITFDTKYSVTEATFVYVFFYEDQFISIGEKGDIANPDQLK